MIEVCNITKNFEEIKAVDHVNLTIKEGNVFGLIGTNGAGKSTMLRMMSGVMKPDEGKVLIDGIEIFDNVQAKERIFFIADEPYFFANATPEDMERYYSSVFPKFDILHYYEYLEHFGLQRRRKISTFSKGMKKQLALLCGICAGTKYIYCDETFDGLDPVMRQGIKAIMAKEMDERGMTPVIASHNLRELEDICDHVAFLHRGKLLFQRELDDMKLSIQKIQAVFTDAGAEKRLADLPLLNLEKRGSMYTIVARGGREELDARMREMEPQFYEFIPLTLEEIFISEMGDRGYDFSKILA